MTAQPGLAHMPYSCTRMATVGVKGLKINKNFLTIKSTNYVPANRSNSKLPELLNRISCCSLVEWC